jgi:hypothetical protein
MEHQVKCLFMYKRWARDRLMVQKQIERQGREQMCAVIQSGVEGGRLNGAKHWSIKQKQTSKQTKSSCGIFALCP